MGGGKGERKERERGRECEGESERERVQTRIGNFLGKASYHQPQVCEQIVCFNPPDLMHTPSNSNDHQYKSKAPKRGICPHYEAGGTMRMARPVTKSAIFDFRFHGWHRATRLYKHENGSDSRPCLIQSWGLEVP